MTERNDPKLQIVPAEGDINNPAPIERPARRTNFVGSAVYLLGLSSLLGAVSYGTYKYLDQDKVQPNGYTYQLKNERSLDRLLELIKFPESTPPDSEVVKRYLIANYYEGRTGLDAFSDFELKTGNDDEIKKMIGDKRIKLAFLGAEILAAEDPGRNIVVDKEKGEVTFEGKYFDVKNSRHLFILDEIIGQNFILIDPDKTPEEKYKASKWIEDLNWLADSNVPVQFESNNIGYPPKDSLRVLARFYRTLDGLGIENLPKKIVYMPYLIDPNLGYAGGIYRKATEEINIQKSSGDSAVPHEEGHHQADVNNDFSQRKFNELVDDVKSKVQGDYDPRDVLITPGVMDAGKMGSNTEFEDYAETIRMYFWDGVAFRRRIEELKYANSDAVVVLSTKYDFAKLFFKGEEFTREGEVFSVQIGDVFAISDPDPKRMPIPLRQEPLEKAVFTDYVWDSNYIKIIEGPVTTEYRGEEVKMWRVVSGGINNVVGFRETPNANQGWIAEDWFGDEVWAKETDEFKSQ